MRKTIPALFLLLMCALPARAGVEPFFQGEWGMTPQEILALILEDMRVYDANADLALSPDIKIWEVKADTRLELEYKHKIYDYEGFSIYQFKDNALFCAGGELLAGAHDLQAAKEQVTAWENDIAVLSDLKGMVVVDGVPPNDPYKGLWEKISIYYV